jgi:molybdopterin converting factor small subunit
VRYWAGAREVAGTSEQAVSEDSLAQVLAAIRAEHGDRMTRLLRVSVVLVDGQRAEVASSVALAPAAIVEILPPFAGG